MDSDKPNPAKRFFIDRAIREAEFVSKLRLPLFGGLAIAQQGLARVQVALVYQQGKEAHGAQDQQGNLDCQVRIEWVLAFPATHPNLPSLSIQSYAPLRLARE
jgi:hypothetical protein